MERAEVRLSAWVWARGRIRMGRGVVQHGVVSGIALGRARLLLGL